jgi:hypothetical protein
MRKPADLTGGLFYFRFCLSALTTLMARGGTQNGLY